VVAQAVSPAFLTQSHFCHGLLGRDFLCFKFMAPSPFRVILIDYESWPGSLKQRYDGIVAAMRLNEHEQKMLKENLRILEVKKIRKAGHTFPKFPLPGKGKAPKPR